MINQAHIIVLNLYRHIYYTYPYSEKKAGVEYFPRVDAMSSEDEKTIGMIYKAWRNEEPDMSCESCLNEIFSRLMTQMLIQEKEVSNVSKEG